jgi:hypothetical protein
MSRKRKHSSCSLKDKLELLKRIDKGESATRLDLEYGVVRTNKDFSYDFFLHPVRINRNFGLARFGLARLYCILRVIYYKEEGGRIMLEKYLYPVILKLIDHILKTYSLGDIPADLRGKYDVGSQQQMGVNYR